MDIELIIIIVIMAVMLLAISLYMLALYSHADEKDWGASTYCKTLVVSLFIIKLLFISIKKFSF
jgi:uncharacterized membrane protein